MSRVESGLELLVDRFVALDATRAVDLATGDSIVLTVTSAGGASDQKRWALRCDTFLALRHFSIASLVDYGLFGPTQRFEAWRCGPEWCGAQSAAQRAVHRASTFLRASVGPRSRGPARCRGRICAGLRT
jgi:hypothetical protein